MFFDSRPTRKARVEHARRAMEAPLREIVNNCGEEPSVLNNVKQGTGNYGYNAQTGEYGDMVAMGGMDF